MELTVKETAEWLLQRDNFLLFNHIRPDGDAHGSAAALCDGLRRCGKTAYVFENPESTPRFIPIVEGFYPPADFSPDYRVTLDTASLNMLVKGAPEDIDLSIDHHPSNSGYAKNLCLNGDRSSCGEIVYEILNELGCGLSPASAEAIYIAVSTDTGCFAFANATSNSLRVAAAAVDAGAQQQELNKRYFRTKTKGRIAIEGHIMSNIHYYFNDTVAIVSITRALMDGFGVTENDMDDIAAIPGAVDGVEVGITIRELEGGGKCKSSVRSGPEFDCNALCSRFGGGGHKMASGCSLPVDVTEMERLFVEALGDILKR